MTSSNDCNAGCAGNSLNVSLGSSVIAGDPFKGITSGPVGPPGPAGPVGTCRLTRSFAMRGTTLDKVIVLHVSREITVENIQTAIIGSSGSTAYWNLFWSPTANGVGTAFFSTDAVTFEPASGNAFPAEMAFVSTPLIIPAGSFIWVDVTSTIGDISQIFWSIEYTVNAVTE